MTTRTFEILVSRLGATIAALEALAKRATRKGLPVLTWTVGKAFTRTEFLPNVDGTCPVHGAVLNLDATAWKVDVARVPLTIEGETPKYAGWTFVAALQHLDGENIIRAVPGETVPEVYRNRGSACDHCKVNRRRNDTYVVRHEDGRTLQVGSTCVCDFLGSDDAGKIAAQAEILALASAVASDGCEGDFGGGAPDRLLSSYLPFVAYSVRVHGWVSRTIARERGGAATADIAWTMLTDPRVRAKHEREVTDEDRSLAASAESWADSLTDETVNAERSDYLHNLRAVARTGLVTSRTAGIAASAVTAYQRHIGKQRQAAERAARPSLDAHVGTVGARTTFRVTLDFVTGYEGAYGYTTVLKFRTAEGACIVWKASNTDLGRGDVGKAYTLTGTIKAHDEYKGAKQTIVTRCKAVAA